MKFTKSDWTVIAICVPVLFFSFPSAVRDFKRWRQPMLYHVQLKAGNVVLEDYFTTNKPEPRQIKKEWFYYLPIPAPTNFLPTFGGASRLRSE